jgi:hypothetical protein
MGPPTDHQGPARSRGASRYGGGSTIWASRVYPCHRAKAVQDLISLYEKSAETTAPSSLTVAFEQVSGDVQVGGAPPRNELIVGGGGPEATAAAGSLPAVSTAAHNPTTHPFGPNQVQEFTAAQAALDGLTARRVQVDGSRHRDLYPLAPLQCCCR